MSVATDSSVRTCKRVVIRAASAKLDLLAVDQVPDVAALLENCRNQFGTARRNCEHSPVLGCRGTLFDAPARNATVELLMFRMSPVCDTKDRGPV
jgi:hypothetical protein